MDRETIKKADIERGRRICGIVIGIVILCAAVLLMRPWYVRMVENDYLDTCRHARRLVKYQAELEFAEEQNLTHEKQKELLLANIDRFVGVEPTSIADDGDTCRVEVAGFCRSGGTLLFTLSEGEIEAVCSLDKHK